MRPTTKDLAKAAGVSLATVDRVLNARPGVRKKTVEAVNTAIEEIGFVRNVSAANLARGKFYRFRFLLPSRADQFIQAIKTRIEEAAINLATEGVLIEHGEIPANDPHKLAQLLHDYTPATVDGIALMAPESPQARDSMVRLRENGIQVVQFISGQHQDDAPDFIGIDNAAAGATAASLIGRFTCHRPGKVLVIAETMHARDSLERRRGFDTLLCERYPQLTALPSLETYGNPQRTAQIISNAIKNHPDITATYIMSSEARMPLDALTDATDPATQTIIAHERTARTEHGLLSGEIDALIAQNPGHLVRSAIRQMRARCEQRDILASQENIRIEILMRENM